MANYRTAPANELDSIRRARGVRACRSAFYRLGQQRRETAVRLINGDNLQFASLYVLRASVEELGMSEQLCDRNRIALIVSEKIISGKKSDEASEAAISLNDETVHSVLMWMFQTGIADDGLSEEFDEILDITASILIKTHHEQAILPSVADLIFQRNRKDAYAHDLTWAYFQSHSPEALRHIAKKLTSNDRRDVKLACTLLNFDPDELKTLRDRQKKYSDFSTWLDENNSYLYFTNESFQLTNSPNVCGVDLEAKYLSKEISPKSRKPLSPLTAQELSSLNQFKATQDDDKSILAKYSRKLHDEDPSYWEQWIHFPVAEQIRIARYDRREGV